MRYEIVLSANRKGAGVYLYQVIEDKGNPYYLLDMFTTNGSNDPKAWDLIGTATFYRVHGEKEEAFTSRTIKAAMSYIFL